MVLITTVAIFTSYTILAAIKLSTMTKLKKRHCRCKRSSKAKARIHLKTELRRSQRFYQNLTLRNWNACQTFTSEYNKDSIYYDSEDGQDQFYDSLSHQPDNQSTFQKTLKSQDSSNFEGDTFKVFTTSLADTDLETLNTQVPLDTDSVFFVCENSTTGHICNDIRKFVPGTICNTMRRLTTANGTGPCLQ